MTTCSDPRYAGYRFTAEIIATAVGLYLRFPLSLQMGKEMLAARGIAVSHEGTVRLAGAELSWHVRGHEHDPQPLPRLPLPSRDHQRGRVAVPPIQSESFSDWFSSSQTHGIYDVIPNRLWSLSQQVEAAAHLGSGMALGGRSSQGNGTSFPCASSHSQSRPPANAEPRVRAGTSWSTGKCRWHSSRR